MNKVYLHNQWLPADQATVSVQDRGFLFGDGVYEVIAIHQGIPLLLRTHLARLQYSARAIGIHKPEDFFSKTLVDLCLESIRQNPNAAISGKIYLQLTRGHQPLRQHTHDNELEPTLYIATEPQPPYLTTLPKISAYLMNDLRWQRCDVKSTSLVGHVMLAQKARSMGYDEALLARNNHVYEGATSNFFCVHDGVIYTPPADHSLLNGTLRLWILELSNRLNIPHQIMPITVDFLYQADEIWATSSTRFLQHVTALNGRAMLTEKPLLAPIFWRALQMTASNTMSMEDLDRNLCLHFALTTHSTP